MVEKSLPGTYQTPIMFYVCPDCQGRFHENSIAHEHSDKTWVYTRDLIAYYQYLQIKKWEALDAQRTRL